MVREGLVVLPATESLLLMDTCVKGMIGLTPDVCENMTGPTLSLVILFGSALFAFTIATRAWNRC